MTDGDFRSDHIKLCVLWYDEIIVETIGDYDEKRFIAGLIQNDQTASSAIHALTDVIRPLDKQLREHVNGDYRSRLERGYPRWGSDHENYTYPEPENAEQYAHNHLLGLIAQEHSVARFDDGYDIEQAEGRARVAVDAVRLWEGVNNEMPCMLQANLDEKAAMTAAMQFAGSGPQAAPFNLFEIAIPSLRDVAWGDVVKFRKNDSLKSLRSEIAQSLVSAGSNLEAAKALFDEAERTAIDVMVENSRPRVKRVAIESVLANLPGLPVNPFSVFFGIRDTTAAYKRNRDHGWFYLLRDIKTAVGGLDSQSSCFP